MSGLHYLGVLIDWLFSLQSTDSPAGATSTECATDSDSDATVIVDFPDDEEPRPLSPPAPLSSLVTHRDDEQHTLKDSIPDTLSNVAAPMSVHCPLCGQPFPAYAIELHAASCGDMGSLPVYID